jgi:ribosome-associated protein
MAEPLRVTRTCAIDAGEIEWRFMPSGGPGGQHANKTATRVEARFDIAASPSLGPVQRRRLVERYGPVLRVVVDAERSQLRNRAIALERLASRLADGLHVERPRRPTAPSRAAKAARVDDKRRRSAVKQRRRRPSADE